MAVLNVVLLVLFIIVALLLILFVLVQNEEGDSLGGVFASGSSSAFGSRSGNILTRASSVLGALFLILSFGIALANRTPSDDGVKAAGRIVDTEQGEDWWQDETSLEGGTPEIDAPSPIETETLD